MLVQTEAITNSKQSFTDVLGVPGLPVIPVYNHTINMLVQTEDITNSKQSFTDVLGVLGLPVIPVYNHTINMLVQTEDITNSKQSFTDVLGVPGLPVITIYNHTINMLEQTMVSGLLIIIIHILIIEAISDVTLLSSQVNKTSCKHEQRKTNQKINFKVKAVGIQSVINFSNYQNCNI